MLLSAGWTNKFYLSELRYRRHSRVDLSFMNDVYEGGWLCFVVNDALFALNVIMEGPHGPLLSGWQSDF